MFINVYTRVDNVDYKSDLWRHARNASLVPTANAALAAWERDKVMQPGNETHRDKNWSADYTPLNLWYNIPVYCSI